MCADPDFVTFWRANLPSWRAECHCQGDDLQAWFRQIEGKEWQNDDEEDGRGDK
jgi:hypothetical protein